MHTRVVEMFDIQFPIFAFSHCRDVVAAVSRAGGLGVLGALAFSPEQLEIELKWIEEHVDGKPYGVDIVVPVNYLGVEEGGLDKSVLEGMIPEKHKQYVEDVLDKYNVPQMPADHVPHETLLGWSAKGARSHVDIALQHPGVKLIVNALGTPPRDVVDKAHAQGVKFAALVGRVEQALDQVAAGVDIVVAQGSEAGGHTGEVSTMVLVPDVVDAIAPTPVLAAGGIGCGRQMAAAMALGADGVWTGSIWLTTTESDVHPIAVQKLLKAKSRDTVRSRSLTGKPARQLKTDWTEAWDGPNSPGTLQMPLQFMLTADAVSRIHHYASNDKYGAKDLLGHPVGQVVGRMNAVRPTKEVIYDMVNEYVDTMSKMTEALAAAEK